MSLAFTVPAPGAGRLAYCTVSALDQRDWGGCVDIMIQPRVTNSVAGSSTTTKSVAAAGVGGTYKFTTQGCLMDSPGCCCISGSVEVVHYPPGIQTLGTVSLEANTSSGCEGKTFARSVNVNLLQVEGSSGFTGTFDAGNDSIPQQAELSVFGNSVLDLTNIDEAPSICSAFGSSDSGGQLVDKAIWVRLAPGACGLFLSSLLVLS